MFEKLPETFRSHGLQADVRTLLLFRKAIDSNLVKTLGDAYQVLKAFVVKDPSSLGPYTKAYYEYFLNIDIHPGERLNDAIIRSESFRNWKEDYQAKNDDTENWTMDDWVDKFLSLVHLTQYDIKRVIDGKSIFDKDDPHLKDEISDGVEEDAKEHRLDTMADYSELSLEELLERMEQIADEQKSRHDGGSHWIGTGGISPYGHGGAAKGGIRKGGTGGGKLARKVLADPNFFPVDRDALINDNNVDAALASLKGIFEESAQDFLDVDKTIKEGLKRAGLFLPELTKKFDEKLQVILLIDNGGWSMTPYVRTIQELFKKMKTRFAQDLETYYFHNTIYDKVYKDPRRTKGVYLERLLKKDPNYKVFIIGDAAMAPYELSRLSVGSLKAIQDKFKKTVWLNPEPARYWNHTLTTNIIKQIFKMYPLTPRGIEKAVQHINKKTSK